MWARRGGGPGWWMSWPVQASTGVDPSGEGQGQFSCTHAIGASSPVNMVRCRANFPVFRASSSFSVGLWEEGEVLPGPSRLRASSHTSGASFLGEGSLPIEEAGEGWDHLPVPRPLDPFLP